MQKRNHATTQVKVRFLGTGTSHGIPVIGCKCPVCCSQDPRDQRTRTSVLVEQQGVKLLVDAPPELRLQLLQADCGQADAMLLTHAHADHISGLDDVRIFSEQRETEFPVYGPASALRSVRERFGYVFRNTQKGGGKPRLELLPVNRPFKVKGITITPIPLWHGRLRVFGYRIGNFAYCTDVSRIPADSYHLLRGLQVLVLDALRPSPHETHFSLDQALLEAKLIHPRRTYFTHMCHLLGHQATEKKFPRNIRLAYDGLEIKVV